MQQIVADAEPKVLELTAYVRDFESDLGGLTHEDWQVYGRLQVDHKKASEDKARAEVDLHRHIIKIRNRKVERGLQSRYRENASGRPFKIFCVSTLCTSRNVSLPSKKPESFLN